jgi:hypothetical protein
MAMVQIMGISDEIFVNGLGSCSYIAGAD